MRKSGFIPMLEDIVPSKDKKKGANMQGAPPTGAPPKPKVQQVLPKINVVQSPSKPA